MTNKAEKLLVKIADNFSNIGKAFHSIEIIRKMKEELCSIDDIATMGLKLEFKKRNPDVLGVMKLAKDMVDDGYKGFSIDLTKSIETF